MQEHHATHKSNNLFQPLQGEGGKFKRAPSWRKKFRSKDSGSTGVSGGSFRLKDVRETDASADHNADSATVANSHGGKD